MHVGIDYTAAALQGAGIGKYTRGLIDALVPLMADSDGITLLYPGDRPLYDRDDWPAYVTVKRLPVPDRYQTILWHRLKLPIPVERFCGPIDIFHAPNFLLPPVRKARTLLTIHDLAFLVHPEYAHPDLQRFLAKAVPRSLARADHILADSRASKEDAVRLFNLAPDNVTVVGAGVESRFRPLPLHTLEAVRESHQLDFPFVLSVSTLEPRKNFDGLIRAFVQARTDLQSDYHLVIAGGSGWLYEDIFTEVEQLDAGAYVHFLGYVDDADLPALYNLADLYAFPSHYEGFGITVLEAMACGTPVICSDTSSLPEIAGDAAYVIPTGDEMALVESLKMFLKNPDLRADYGARGPKQAATWTWDAAAARLLDVYRMLAT